jgi:hypothetical protein
MPQVIALVGAVGSVKLGAGALAAAGTIGAKIAAGAMIAGGVMTGVGAVTKNQKLMKWGSVLSVAGGLGSWASGTLPGMGGGEAAGGAAGGAGSGAPGLNLPDAALGEGTSLMSGASTAPGLQATSQSPGLLGTAGNAAEASTSFSGGLNIDSILAKSPGTQSVARAMANAPAQSSTGLLGTVNKGVGYIQRNKDAFKLLGDVAAPIAQHLGEQDERKQFIKMRDRERQTFNDSIRNLRIPTLTVTRGV